MKKARKEFDAVGIMRKIRDQLSTEIEGMTFEEEKLFIQKQVAKSDARHRHKPRHAAMPPSPLRSGGRVREQV